MEQPSTSRTAPMVAREVPALSMPSTCLVHSTREDSQTRSRHQASNQIPSSVRDRRHPDRAPALATTAMMTGRTVSSSPSLRPQARRLETNSDPTLKDTERPLATTWGETHYRPPAPSPTPWVERASTRTRTALEEQTPLRDNPTRLEEMISLPC